MQAQNHSGRSDCETLQGGLVFHGGEWPSRAEDEMTLVFALQGNDEIVVAADSMAHDGPDWEGRYKFSVRKLLPVGDKWVLGFAQTQIGYDLYQQIHAREPDRRFSPNIHLGAHEYAARMHQLYEEIGYAGDAQMLLCGFGDLTVNDSQAKEPATYRWKLDRDGSGKVIFQPPQLSPERAGIGASQHGALYFANAFHTPQLDTKQRILLAYFCVSEAAKHDLRVGGNVEVALVTESGVKMFSQAELAEVERASTEIAAWLAGRFAAAGPPIAGL